MNTITRPAVSLTKHTTPAVPLARGTLYEIAAKDLRVGDTVVLGNCVRTVTAAYGRSRDWDGLGGFEWVHRFTMRGGNEWALADGRYMMVVRP